jgi:hypothetical protein
MTDNRQPTTVNHQPSAAKWLTLAALAALAAAVLYFRDPHVPNSYGVCPFHWLTGLWCPGCGATRAVHDALHLRFVRALRENALTMLAAPFILVAVARMAWRDLVNPHLPPLRISPFIGWIALAVALVFWIVRNLPWAPFTWLAP